MSGNVSEIESYFDDLEKQLVNNDEQEIVIYQEDEEKCVDGVIDHEDDEEDNNEDDEGGKESDDGGDSKESVEDAQVILNDDDIDDDELEDGTIFMDAEGNYYYQSGKKAVPVKPIQPVKKRKRSSKAAKGSEALTKKYKPATPSTRQTRSKEKLNISPSKSISTPSKSRHKPGPACSKKTRTKTPANTASETESAIKTRNDIEFEKSPAAGITRSIEIEQVAKVEQTDLTSTTVRDDTLMSEINIGEEIYEFEETEQNIDDPDDPDYTVEPNDNDSDYIFENEGKVKLLGPSKPDASGLYQCIMCPYNTQKKFLLARHLRTHSNERPYKCSVCERGFKTNIALVNHINTHLGNKPHQCADCEKAFTTSGELTRHRRYRHTGIKPHKCTECDYCSVELSKLRRHMRCHTGERPYQCPHCTYASPDTFKLKRHMRIHTGEKPYECDICHSRFTQSNSLKYHRLIHSVNDKPVFQCNLCPTTCGRKTDLRLHIQKQHNTENPVTCKRCGKVLPDRYTYKMHVKTHEGEKCYRCKLCTYASISQRHLDTHMLLHTDSKPFECEMCEQSFRQKQLLNRHIKVYHMENYEPPVPRKKAHRCPHCERSFAFNGNLIRHMETHDPNSQQYEEKLQLKLGRMKRVRPDGTIVTKIKTPFVYPDDEVMDEELEDDELEMDEEKVEYDEENEGTIQYVYEEYEGEDDEQVTDDKAEILLKQEYNPMAADKKKLVGYSTSPYKTVSVKKENDTEFMEVQVDDSGYMVIEVMPAEDGEEQTSFVEEAEMPRRNQTSVTKSSIPKGLADITSDCFGFDDDAEADEVEDDAAHELIQLLSQE